MSERPLVFADIESTGLIFHRHEVVELAWAVEDGPIRSVRLRHTLRNHEPVALQINRYHERELGDPALICTPEQISQFILDVRDATLVAANPHFDASFLYWRFEHAPWHYRLHDIQSYAAGVLGWTHPQSLKTIREALVERGHDLPEPDHTAVMDVRVLRAAYRALRAEQVTMHQAPAA